MKRYEEDMDDVMMRLREVFYEETSHLEESDKFDDEEDIKTFIKPDLFDSTDN